MLLIEKKVYFLTSNFDFNPFMAKCGGKKETPHVFHGFQSILPLRKNESLWPKIVLKQTLSYQKQAKLSQINEPVLKAPNLFSVYPKPRFWSAK